MSAPWDDLKAQSREYRISKIQEGDLIKLRSNVLSIIYHYGIVFTEDNIKYVYHNTPDYLNPAGGSIVREPLKDWLKDREIISIDKTDLNSDQIHDMVKPLIGNKYDFLNFNCEHFTNFIKSKKSISPQVATWALAITGLGLTFLIYKIISNEKR